MIIVQNVQKAKSHVMIKFRNEDFWKWVVEITDPLRKRMKRRGNDTKLATDHNTGKEIQNIVKHNTWNNQGIKMREQTTLPKKISSRPRVMKEIFGDIILEESDKEDNTKQSSLETCMIRTQNMKS